MAGIGLGAAGDADADAVEGAAIIGEDGFHFADDGVDGLARVVGKNDDVLGDDPAAEVDDGDGCLRGVNVEGDDGALFVEVQEGGAPAAGEASSRAFNDPTLADERFDDKGDGAALQAGEPGEVCARERLAGTDEIEDEVSIDLARGLVRGAPIAGEGEADGRVACHT